MRLSKTRKQTIKDHQNLNLPSSSLNEIRSIRKFICRHMNKQITVIHEDEPRVNPKKNRKARRQRNPLQGIYYLKYANNNKYPYNPMITKKRKYGTTKDQSRVIPMDWQA